MTVSRRKFCAGIAALAAAPYSSLSDDYKPFYEDVEFIARNAVRDAVQADAAGNYFGIMSVEAKTVTIGRQLGKTDFTQVLHGRDILEMQKNWSDLPDNVYKIGDKVRVMFNWGDDDHGE